MNVGWYGSRQKYSLSGTPHSGNEMVGLFRIAEYPSQYLPATDAANPYVVGEARS